MHGANKAELFKSATKFEQKMKACDSQYFSL